MKQCNKCEETKELDGFCKNTSSPDGRSGDCKSCRAVYDAKRHAGMSYEPVDSKDCSRCGEHKQAAEFNHDKCNPTGLRSTCKDCERERHLLKRYDMTITDFDDMLEVQGGCCAICATDTPGGSGGRFHVDHCHKTGVVRGLLCSNCNTSLGGFQDSKVNLAAAIIYLEVNEP